MSDSSYDSKQYKYDAFISYRHVEPDMSIASKVHSIIESFKVPKEFYINGLAPKYRVFRDKEELTATCLSEAIRDALEHSKYLIIICSKRTKSSEWCMREVDTFINLHGIDRIIPVLIEGEPSDSYPPILLNLTNSILLDDGTTSEEDTTILACELRPLEVMESQFCGYETLESTNPAKLTSLTKQALKLLNLEKFRIMATMLNISYGDLRQRDKERHTKRMFMMTALISSVLLIFGIFMFNAYIKENISRKEAIANSSALLMNTAREYLEDGDKIKALLIADLAMSNIDIDINNYSSLKNQHIGIINDSIYSSGATIKTIIDTQNSITNFDYNPDGSKLFAGLGFNQIGIWSSHNGALLDTLNGHKEQVISVDISPNGEWLASGSDDKNIIIWNIKDNPISSVTTIQSNDIISSLSFSKNSKYLYLTTRSYLNTHITVYDTSTWQPLNTPITLANAKDYYAHAPSTNIDGDKLLVTYRGSTVNQDAQHPNLVLYDLHTNEAIKTYSSITVKEYIYNIETQVNEEKSVAHLYYTAKLLDNGTILTCNKDNIMLLDTENGNVIKKVKNQESMDAERAKITISNDGDSFYINLLYDIIKCDINTLRTTKSIELIFSPIKSYSINSIGDIVCLHDDNTLSYSRNGVLVSQNVYYGNKNASMLITSPDNKNFAILSNQDMSIKLMSLASSSTLKPINGQVCHTTTNSNYSLFYRDYQFQKRNNITGDIISIPKEIINYENPTISAKEFYHFVLSNDGNKLAYKKYSDTEEDPYIYDKQSISIEVIDLITGKNILSNSDNPNNAVYEFTSDSKNILIGYFSGKLDMISLETGSLVKSLQIPQSNISSLVIIDDASVVAVNYTSGKSTLINMNNGQTIVNLPGKILKLSYNIDKKLEARGLFNNNSMIWVDGKIESLTPLPDVRIRYGENEEYNIPNYDFYNSQKSLLLSIRSQKDNNGNLHAYLIDFNTGELYKSFSIFAGYLVDMVYGYISPDGNSVVLDNNYVQYLLILKGNMIDYNKNVNVVKTSLIYDLLDYESLLKISSDMIGGRKLTPTDMQKLGVN